MSGERARRWLMLETFYTTDLSYFGPEAVGAALLIVMYEAAGHDLRPEQMHRIAFLSKRRWAKLETRIMGARAVLRRQGEPRYTIGRRPLSRTTRERIFARDGRVCCYCGDTEGPFHIDHVVPVARGGHDGDDNLCVACATCNFTKRASLNSEWIW